MSQRLIIGLEPAADWAKIKEQLVADGADWVRDPSPAQPDVLVATVPENRSVDEFLRLAKRLPGVRYVEPDAMQWTS